MVVREIARRTLIYSESRVSEVYGQSSVFEQTQGKLVPAWYLLGDFADSLAQW